MAAASTSPSAATWYHLVGVYDATTRQMILYADGNITTAVYDAAGNRVSRTLPPYTPPGASAPITATTVWQYDKENQLLSEQDPLANTTSYTHDQLGNLATRTTPDGGVTHATYDLDGEQLSITDATGAQRQATYDLLGRTVTDTTLERYPSTSTLTTTYSYAASTANPGGAGLAAVTSPDGTVTSYSYNGAGQKLSTTDPAGNTTAYAYTFMGVLSSTTRPDGTKTQLAYDPNEKITDTVNYDHTGTVLTHQSNAYDAAGNMVASTDARGNTTTYTYDATGTLAQEVQPVTSTSSVTTSFGYDPAGNRTRYTDGRGVTWYTTYNSWNTMQSEIAPATTGYSSAADSTTSYAYDADGRLATETLPGGVNQSFGYDVMGDLQTQQGAGASAATATRSFTYDKAGRVLTAGTSNTSSTGIANATSESFSYDDRGDLLTAGGAAGSTTLAYNGDGLPTARSDASGTSSYGYDSHDLLRTVSDALTGTTQTYTSYNKLNQVTSINEGSGDIRTLTYDDLHRLTGDQVQTPGGVAVASIGYGYDANSNLTSKNTTGFGTAAANTYTYDRADRLASWNNGTTTVGYGYDAAGNRTQIGSKTFTYDARDQLTGDGTTGYAYTAAGVMSAQGATALTSDAYGQQSTDGAVSYTYDASGRMVQRGDAGGAQTMQYSGTGNLLAADGQFLYSRDPAGGLLGVRAATGTADTAKLALTDLHTDVVATMSTTDTTLTQTATYDPLGNPVGAHTTLGNLGYQSEYSDPGTGKVNMAARWYNPATGQFTSKDTVKVNPSPVSAAANPFAYAGDDPLTRTDPSGHRYTNAEWETSSVAPDARSYQWKMDNGLSPNDDYVTPYDVDAHHAGLVRKGAAHHRFVKMQHYVRYLQPDDVDARHAGLVRKAAARGIHLVIHQPADVSPADAKPNNGSSRSPLSRFLDTLGNDIVDAGKSTLYNLVPGSCIIGGIHACVEQAEQGIHLAGLAWDFGSCMFGQGCDHIKKDFDCQNGWTAECNANLTFFVAIILLTKGVGKSAAADDAAAEGGAARAGEASRGKSTAIRGCSFAGSTPVLMADRSVKPIDHVKIGDLVSATDPANGKAVAKAVTALHDDLDTDMADVTVADNRGTLSTIHTTQNHPFWDATTSQWTRADHLHAGDHLKSTAVAAAYVVTVKTFTQPNHRLNLTVADLHTYYVLAGNTPVLVHNEGCGTYENPGHHDPHGGPNPYNPNKAVLP